MIKSGLVSVTFRSLSSEKIISLVSDANLKGIEWGGDIHVPHGDINKARQVARQTIDAGLETAAYGSYYRIGQSEQEGLPFQTVLDTAQSLQAPLIRVWAGTKEANEADEDYYKMTAEQTRQICEIAGSAGISIAYEFHRGTLTNTAQSAKKLLDLVKCDNLFTLWQPILEVGFETNYRGLDLLASKVANIHVFYWTGNPFIGHLFKEEADIWKQYIKRLTQTDGNHYALIEFVKDDDPQNFIKDAEFLTKLVSKTIGRYRKSQFEGN